MELVLIWVALSVVAGVISNNKGNGFAIGFLLSLFLSPLVGLIVALAQRPKEKVDQEVARKVGAYGGFRKCPFCAEAIRIDAKKCRYCGSDVEPQKQPPSAFPAPPAGPNVNRRDRWVFWIAAALLVVGVPAGIAIKSGWSRIWPTTTWTPPPSAPPTDTDVVARAKRAVARELAEVPAPIFGDWATWEQATSEGTARVACGSVSGRTEQRGIFSNERAAYYVPSYVPSGGSEVVCVGESGRRCREVLALELTQACLSALK